MKKEKHMLHKMLSSSDEGHVKAVVHCLKQLQEGLSAGDEHFYLTFQLGQKHPPYLVLSIDDDLWDMLYDLVNEDNGCCRDCLYDTLHKALRNKITQLHAEIEPSVMQEEEQ